MLPDELKNRIRARAARLAEPKLKPRGNPVADPESNGRTMWPSANSESYSRFHAERGLDLARVWDGRVWASVRVWDPIWGQWRLRERAKAEKFVEAPRVVRGTTDAEFSRAVNAVVANGGSPDEVTMIVGSRMCRF